ncbi:major capsid protein [Pectobacterium phage PP47]|uniref:Major capsid protein n=2 Tax=Pektosvirus TaxID=2732689 RepID=A0A1L7DS26_9CAUD|nr:major head protein [Pectobacterium phage PP81]YP_009788738.1 major head protein [Pectobacterium phage PP47]APU03056.1 major capsid protein [Pectobacterium phage PP81]APW79776.1 major capsid protein [Pectobacterium phage PP47]
MANMQGGQQIGTNQGKGQSAADKLALFLKVFGGEVLTAFTRTSVTMNRHMIRSIASGKSAQFPVLGRTKAAYLQAGESLDDKRKDMKHTEKVINIDGLLTADVLIYDIEDAMNHYDVRAEYTAQLGESLAMAADGAVLAEGVGLCNLPAASNENITGLGAAEVITLEGGNKAALEADTVKLGEALIKMLTLARAKMTTKYVPANDRVFYTKPEYYSAILAALMPNSANYAALIDPERGSIRNVMGFEVVEVPHLTSGGAGDDRNDVTTNQKHAIPAESSATVKVALDNIAGIFQHRSAVGTVKLRDLALERARRAEYQADQIIAKYAMGHGGLRPEAAGAAVFSLA